MDYSSDGESEDKQDDSSSTNSELSKTVAESQAGNAAARRRRSGSDLPDPADAKDLPDSLVVRFDVVVGIQGIERTKKDATYEQGRPTYADVDFTAPAVQRALAKLCEPLSDPDRLLFRKSDCEWLELLQIFPRYDECTKDEAAFMTAVELDVEPCSSCSCLWRATPAEKAWPIADLPNVVRNATDKCRKYNGACLYRDYNVTRLSTRVQSNVGFNLGRDDIAWIRVMHVHLNLDNFAPSDDIVKVMELWDKHVKDVTKDEAKLNAFVASSRWVLAQLESSVLRSAAVSAGISIAVSFGTLLFFTGSLQLAVIVVLSVACIITLMLVTMTSIMRWKFGAIEALVLIVLVGFSVDYSLHIAEAIRFAPHPRLEHTMDRVGIAILCAAATTLGSSFFLLFCKIQPLVTFGAGIIWNALWSASFAILILPSALDILAKVLGQADPNENKVVWPDADDDPYKDHIAPGWPAMDAAGSPRAGGQAEEEQAAEMESGSSPRVGSPHSSSTHLIPPGSSPQNKSKLKKLTTQQQEDEYFPDGR